MSPEDRRRYARQLLLSEVGSQGQARLLEACASFEGPGAEVAALYARRAGLRAGGEPRAMPHVVEGEPSLRAAAEFVAGALGAVEAIKQTLEVGQPFEGDVELRSTPGAAP